MTEPQHHAGDPVVAVRIDVDGTVAVLTDHRYETLRDAVGGLIESCPTAGSCSLWVNEEGKVLGLPRNPYGEALWFLIGDAGCLGAGDWMAGPCVVTGPPDADGELLAVEAWIVDAATTVTTIATRSHCRLPMAPLEEALNRRYYNLSASADRQCGGRLSTRRVAELVGFTRKAIDRWRTDGVPMWSADRAAITAGFHPLEVWPDFHHRDVRPKDRRVRASTAARRRAQSDRSAPARAGITRAPVRTASS